MSKSSKIKLGISILAVSALAITAFIADDSKLLGIDKKAIDSKVSPRQDFYNYANGTWLANNPVPSDLPRWGSFDALAEENRTKIRTVIESAAADKKAMAGSNQKKLGDFYNTAMDTVKIEKQGYAPIKGELTAIDNIKSNDDLMKALAHLHQIGFGGYFGFYVYRDIKHSERNICYLTQGGTGLPDRDYYLKDDDRSKNIRNDYVKHIENMLRLVGDKDASANAKSILDMETAIATICKPRVDLRDDEANYNISSIEAFVSENPTINWNLFFKQLNVGPTIPMSVNQPAFFTRIAEIMAATPLNVQKAYMKMNVIRGSAGQLSSAFVNENFNFNGKILNGTTTMRPRWKRVVGACDDALGEIVGQLYVEKYFSQTSKDKVEKMVANILLVYKTRIEQLDWMSPETKTKALDKLAKFNTKLGYPKNWRDYSKLTIGTESYAANMMNASKFEFDFMMSKLGKPIDKDEWQMLPHQVNAYYDPTLNEIVFPAAIMQPPFFYPEADDAVNYGAIGAVIGHEITHGFDDQGSKYDGDGNLNDWWTDADRTKFDEKAKVLIDQFNKYEALPGSFVNGELTIGENIADLGGLNTAYNAYQISLNGKPAATIDGFTGDQRFFLAFSQVWRVNFKEEYLRKMLLTDVHAPGPFRSIATPSNMTEFYKAFNVVSGDSMFREPSQRAKIW